MKEPPESHFFAYLARMKFIRRWGLMRNSLPENIQEHSLQVAMVAHGLAVIRNKRFGGKVDPARAALLGLFHDASEVITGDLATPIKCFNPKINKAYLEIEDVARLRLFEMLPEAMRPDYHSLFFPGDADRQEWELVKAADKICAYVKCIEELESGNRAFLKARKTLRNAVEKLKLPEVAYFMEEFLPSFSLTLDELN